MDSEMEMVQDKLQVELRMLEGFNLALLLLLTYIAKSLAMDHAQEPSAKYLKHSSLTPSIWYCEVQNGRFGHF